MEPTVPAGSLVICWRLPFLIGKADIDYGDIISFEDPGSDMLLLKRVIGLPGDILSFDSSGEVYLNGFLLREDYVAKPQSTFAAQEEYLVPAGHIFVMGDNRTLSNDSRWKALPFIPESSIFAKAIISICAPHLLRAQI